MPNKISHQNNQSVIQMEVNHNSSSGKQTRHMNVRYLFAKERVGTVNVYIQNLPVEKMTDDFLKRPL